MNDYVMFEVKPAAVKSLMAILESKISSYSVQMSDPENVATFEALVSLYKELRKKTKEIQE